MKPRLLEILVCTRCHESLALERFATSAPRAGDDVEEGALRCTRCPARFPIIRGVSRMLTTTLLARMRPRYPEFFAAHPEFLAGARANGDALADTLESFTRQRLDFEPPGPAVAHQWRQHLARNLGAEIPLPSLRGKSILDVGCGFGRHMYVAHEQGAEVVGVDLSGGVDRAAANNAGNPRCHIVQADIFDLPFRRAAFDVVWSFGVVHHMARPREGFLTIVPLAKPGGVVALWVYGYRGMAFTYRLSHMRALHRVTRRLSPGARVRASKAVAALLTAVYWGPLGLIRQAGLTGLVRRFPLADYVEHAWLARVAGVHDRLSTPITHFHDREELTEWFAAAGLRDVVVTDTARRGWRAHGRRDDAERAEGASSMGSAVAPRAHPLDEMR